MRPLLSSYRAKKLLMQIYSFGTVTYDFISPAPSFRLAFLICNLVRRA